MKQYFFSFLLALMPFAPLAETTDAPLYQQDSFLNYNYLVDKTTYYGVLQTSLGDDASRFISCKGAIFTEDVNDCELEGDAITIDFSKVDVWSDDEKMVLVGGTVLSAALVITGGLIVSGPVGLAVVGAGTIGSLMSLSSAAKANSSHSKLTAANNEPLSSGSSRLILFKTETEKNDFLELLSENQSEELLSENQSEHEYPEITVDSP